MKITKEQHLQLVGLKTLANTYTSKLEDIRLATLDITKEENEWGLTSDFIYGDRSLKDLLELLNIDIENDGSKS
jgi:hypothetical protein